MGCFTHGSDSDDTPFNPNTPVLLVKREFTLHPECSNAIQRMVEDVVKVEFSP